MDESMENITIENMRPDIQQAQSKPSQVKSKLTYRDEDELDTGMQKVQPLPFLDEDIQKHKKVIVDSVESAALAQDDIPRQVCSQVDHVISMATQGKTTLFKASEVLEQTMDAYRYARFAALDGFDLKRMSSKLLSEYDETLKAMIRCRLEAQLDDASSKEDECTRKLVEAVRAAESDLTALQERSKVEEEKMSNDMLSITHSNVQEMIRDENSELDMMKQQCITDLKTIDDEVDQFHEKMGDATNTHMQQDDDRKAQLEKNRQEQRRLEERLRKLREEERRLEKEITDGDKLQKKSEEVWVEATDKINSWKEKIEELQRRTQVSLEVMKEMTKCADTIMDDAKKKKEEWMQRLQKYEEESLLLLRDALLARGSMLTMSSADIKDIIRDIKTTLDKDKREKMDASRKGFKMKVDEITEKMKRYSNELEQRDERLKVMSQNLDEVKTRLGQVDEKLRQLRPGIRLDSLEDRYTECKKLIEKAWSCSSVEGIDFKSARSYP